MCVHCKTQACCDGLACSTGPVQEVWFAHSFSVLNLGIRDVKLHESLCYIVPLTNRPIYSGDIAFSLHNSVILLMWSSVEWSSSRKNTCFNALFDKGVH